MAMKPGGKLFVVEHVLGPDPSPEGPFMDLMMMVMNGGRERTRDEFSALFSAAGFRVTSVTSTATALSLIEGVIDGRQPELDRGPACSATDVAAKGNNVVGECELVHIRHRTIQKISGWIKDFRRQRAHALRHRRR